MKVGVDLGSAAIRAWVPERGLVVQEPSVLARDAGTGRVLACGTAARQMEGRVGSDVRTTRPVVAGRLADPEAAVELVKHAVGRALGWRWSLRPSVYVAVSDQPHSHPCQTFLDAMKRLGVKPNLVPRQLASARGAGLAVDEPAGKAVVDLGAGGTEVSIMSMGQIIATRCIPVGGEALDQALLRYLQTQRGLEVGLNDAEDIKIQLGAATPDLAQGQMTIWGRDLATGLPGSLDLYAEEVYQALREPLGRIGAMVKQALEQAPPALADDLVEGGLSLTGGGAQMRGMDKFLHAMTRLPVRLVDNPASCVAAGAYFPNTATAGR